MYYIIISFSTVFGVIMPTLITQSWGWGILIWIIIGFICSVYSLFRNTITTTLLSLNLWLLLGIISWTRLRSHNIHCQSIPDTVEGKATVASIWTRKDNYLITQGGYQRLYETEQALHPGQEIVLYATTQKLQFCITTYTHRDTGFIKLQRWIKGGEFNYHRWLVMKGIDGYINGKVLPNGGIDEQKSYLSTQYLGRVKNQFIDHISRLFPESRTVGWVGGTLIGDKSMIDKSDYTLLIDSGLVHLIVVSGGNLALIILLLSWILFWIPLYIRYIIIGMLLIGYVMLVGADSSVLRALLMSLITIIGTLTGRNRSFGGMLGVVTIMILWYNPFIIYDIGLWLSLSAVTGIYITYQWTTHISHYRSKRRTIQLLRKSLLIISVSIGARLGTLPVLIRQFGSTNITSVIANIITGVIASITMIIELVVIGLDLIIPSDLSFIIQWGVQIVSWLVACIYHIASITTQYGVRIGAHDQQGFWIITGSVVTIFILFYHHTQKMRVKYLLEIQ